MWRFLFIIPLFLGDCIYNFIKIHKNIQYYKKKISSFLMHLLWNECFFNFHFNCHCQIYWNHYFCLCLSSHLHLWSLHTSSILHLWPLHLWSLHLWLFICDLFICTFVFHPWLGTLHWKHKRYQNLKNAIWNKQ